MFKYNQYLIVSTALSKIHAFPVFVSVIPESKEAIERIGKFIQDVYNNNTK